MKWYWANAWLVLSLVVAILASACAPRTAPVGPSPAPVAQPARPAPAPAPAIVSPQERDLTQLVEAARKEGKLTAYSFSFTGDIGQTLQRAFQEKYGIKMDIITGRGAEMGERIKTERRVGSVVADLMESSPTNVTNLKEGGTTAASLDIPVLQEKDVWRVDPLVNDPEGHVLGHRAMNFGPYINTNLVKPADVPKSFKDLLDPRWEGKIVLPDPNVSSGSYDIFMTLVEYKRLDMDTVKAIGLRAKFVPGTRQIAEAVARGEYPIGLGVSDNDSAPFLKEGAPIKAIAMQEGIITLVSSMARVKDGPHPNAAKLFINWMLSKEGQTIYTRTIGLASIRKDVPDSRHPNAQVEAALFPINAEIAAIHAKLLREKSLATLWKK